MTIDRRTLLGSTAAAATILKPGRSRAQTPVVKLGVLNDQSGPYRDIGGMNSVAAVKQAVAEFGADFKVEVVSADHQNKPDVGVGIVRQWFDRDGVDIVFDVPTSSVALAVNSVCKEKNKAYVNTGAGTADLTGPQCTPSTIHWSYDTYMLARSTGGAMVQAGGNAWYFITADYVFGQQLQRDATGFVTKAGGKVLGASAYPFPGTTDFSSFLVSAQASGANVLGLANAGADTINSIKQAAEFGLTRKMKVAAMLMFLNDVHGLGLEAAQGLFLTESFYWDMNEKTRAFTKRFQAFMPGVCPNMTNAGCYSGALHFLKAVKALGAASAKDGATVVAKMKSMTAEDDAYGSTVIRQDGIALTPAYLFEVKKPSESKYPWDYFKLVANTPSDQAWKPLAETGCPLVKV
ncbi:MAG: ABC transporter substrate-binding protein [Oxalobacteraceae bacterium]|nr:MAG: ABC transporter substrate-binding protein [Oxalobacteraceae bacterium]